MGAWTNYQKHEHTGRSWRPPGYEYSSIKYEFSQSQLQEIEEMSVFQCTDEEIAHAFGICERTLYEIIHRQQDVLKHIAIGRSKGKRALRSAQMKIALAGNVNMLMYLGKVVLKQLPEATTTLHLGDSPPASLSDLSPAAKLHLAELAQSITRAALLANTPEVEANVVSDNNGNGNGSNSGPHTSETESDES